jgi:hypothetical protein
MCARDAINGCKRQGRMSRESRRVSTQRDNHKGRQAQSVASTEGGTHIEGETHGRRQAHERENRNTSTP